MAPGQDAFRPVTKDVVTTDATVEPIPAWGTAWGLLALGLALAPALLILAATPAFTTQDGPAHLLNARVLADAVRMGDRSPFASVYRVSARPVPNWTGHVVTAVAVEALPLLSAARVVTAGTLVAVMLGLVVARGTVAGGSGFGGAAVLSVLLGLNVTWLFGFTSFLVGAALVPMTLATWWRSRDRPGPASAVALGVLLVVGYFSHPISLGAAVLGLVVLAVTTPGSTRLVGRRLLWLALGGLPLVPLGVVYALMTRSGGGFEPVWEHLGGRWGSPRAWVSQLSWIDPLSLAARTSAPFALGGASPGWTLVSPSTWGGLGLVLLVGSTWWGDNPATRDRRGWGIVAALLLFLAVVGPDTLGVRHGYYLAQRLALLGLMMLVPWLDLGSPRPLTRVGTGLLGLALGLQLVTVADYAAVCRDRIEPFLRAGDRLAGRNRVGAVVVGTRSRFLANPLLHADCLLGVDPPRIVWGNYETDHYYFPVQVRDGVTHPPAGEFEAVSLLDDPAEADRRIARWAALLEDHHARIDAVVGWQVPPGLAAITERWYKRTGVGGPVEVWVRAETSRPGSRSEE